MKKSTICILLLIIILGLTCVGCQPAGNSGENKGALFQYSTLGSLSAGDYDGEMTFAELKQHGDFGLGTFNGLNGEMIEVDHQAYQVKSDGVAYPVDNSMKTPFAVVTFFKPDQTVKIGQPMDCAQMETYLDSLLPTLNIPFAVKVSGTFKSMETRSEPMQQKPYQPLADVLKTQSVFDFQGIEGVMVGFRLPGYMQVANVTGYHFHFISSDRKAGGHVLKCEVQNATVEIDDMSEWHTILPGDDAFYKVNISK